MLRLDWNLVFTVINLIVLFLLMKKFLIGPITDIMEKRKALIEDQFSKAGNAEKEAMALKDQYENSVKDTRVKMGEMLEMARVNANAEYESIVKEANEKAVKIISDAEKTIRIEREKTLREMKSEIAGLAMVAAAKVMSDNSDSSSNQTLYQNFLKKAGDSNETNSN